MRYDPARGVSWYLWGAAPLPPCVRDGVQATHLTQGCTPEMERAADEDLEAFYDILLPLYARDDDARSDSGRALISTSDGGDAIGQALQAVPGAPGALAPTTQPGAPAPHLAKRCNVPHRAAARGRGPHALTAGPGRHKTPLSTVYSVHVDLSLLSLQSEPLTQWPVSRPAPGLRGQMMGSMRRGVSAPPAFTWPPAPSPSLQGATGSDKGVAALCKAAQGHDAPLLRRLVIAQPEGLACREVATWHTPLSCAIRKERYEHAQLLLSAMRHYPCVPEQTLNAVGFDGRNALMLTVDRDIYNPQAVQLFDALLASGAWPLWQAPMPVAARKRAFYRRARSSQNTSQNAAQYALRHDRCLWLHKLLLWDETQAPKRSPPQYGFDVQMLRGALVSLALPPSAGVRPVLCAAVQRRRPIPMQPSFRPAGEAALVDTPAA